jgi:signal transduction histidine kinase
MRILIVDGAKERRRDLTAVLTELDNVVVQGAVADVRSALQAVAETMPDVVITNVTLPDGDGTYLIERVRALTRTPAVIVLGARAAENQRNHYLSAGADSYLDANDHEGVRAAVVGLSATRSAAGSIPPMASQQLLGRMTAAVVHDFNNYLHAAESSLDLITRVGYSPDLLAGARAALGAMSRLNTTLLAYARGGAPTMTPVDVGETVNDTLAVAHQLIGPDIQVNVDIHDEVRPILAVRTELEQVVLNLVVNACDAMPSGGKLDVVVRQATSAAVLLEVSDTGAGFTDAPKPGRTGAGLGLSIVRAVVTRHAGALRVVARPTGGTTLAVMLPTAPLRGF